jgi:hypothetical protein
MPPGGSGGSRDLDEEYAGYLHTKFGTDPVYNNIVLATRAFKSCTKSNLWLARHFRSPVE